MNNMTEQQWARLFWALGQVPTVDVAMNCSDREARVLHELAMKGADAAQRGFLHYGEGDKLDAIDLAQRLHIDPQTGELRPTQSEAKQMQAASLDWFDRFMDDLEHEGE